MSPTEIGSLIIVLPWKPTTALFAQLAGMLDALPDRVNVAEAIYWLTAMQIGLHWIRA